MEKILIALAIYARGTNASVRLVLGLVARGIATEEPVGKSLMMGSHAEATTTARVVIVIGTGSGDGNAQVNSQKSEIGGIDLFVCLF